MNMELADDHDLATGVAHGRWQAKPRSKFAGEKITHGLKLEEN